MVKLTLTYVDRKERMSKEQPGKPSRPFTSLTIKAQEYNDKFLSGFGNRENAGWKVGDVVEVGEIREVSKDGKIYLNFEMPRMSISDLSKRLEKLEGMHSHLASEVGECVKKIKELTNKPVDDGYPTREKEIGLTEGQTHPFDHTDSDLGTIEEQFKNI